MSSNVVTVVYADVQQPTGLMAGLMADDASAAQPAATENLLAAVRTRIDDYEGRHVAWLDGGLMLAFTAPRAAVAFALSVQRALAAQAPAVRFGINTGEISGDAEDPRGDVTTAAARIARKASKGEVLISEVVRQLVGTMSGVAFVDRGRTRLDGLNDRRRLFAAIDSATAPEPAPVFGRLTELSVVDAVLDRLADGHGGVLVIEGEAGIGKTHLAEAVEARARAAGFRVVAARAEELEPDCPGRLLLAWAEALSLPIRDAPSSDTGSEPESGFSLATAVGDAIENQAVTTPTILIAEDLQWADELSLRGLAAVIRRIQPLAVGLVATMRPSPRPPLLDRVLNTAPGGATRRLRLEGLDPVAVSALASAHSGAPPGANLTVRLDSAAGNPLYALELLRALEEEGRMHVRGGVVEIDEVDLPVGLRETVVRRLRWLPSGSTELLRLASLLGREFTLRDLAAVAGRRVVDVAAELQPAMEAAIVTGTGETLSFRHDLLREAIYGDIAPAIRRDLHAAAGRALASVNAPVLQVARQLELGSHPGDLVAAEWLERAAVEAAPLDVGFAISMFEQALEIGGHNWHRRRNVLMALLEPLASRGRAEEARQLAARLLGQGLDTNDELRVRRGMIAIAANSGDLGLAVLEATHAFGIAGLSPVEDARLHCLEASMAFLSGRAATEVRADADAAIDLASKGAGSAVDELACTAHQTLAFVDGAEGGYESALEHARTAVRLVRTRGFTRSGFLIPEIWEGTLLLFLDRFDEATAAWATQQRQAERRGEMALLVQIHTAMSVLHHLHGRWDDGLTELEAARAVTEEYGNHAHDVGINAIMAWRGLACADPVATAEAIAAGDEAVRRGRHLIGVEILLNVKAKVLAAAGNVNEAVQLLSMAWNAAEHLRGLTQFLYVGPDLIRLAVQQSRTEIAAGVADTMAQIASRTKAPSAHAAAARAHGLAHDDVNALTESVSIYRGTPRRYELAGACEDAGVTLLRSGRIDDAAALLEEAAAIHIACGASGETARIDALLREHGIRKRRGRASALTHGWESLSPTENKVVALVTDGLSNPQIAASLFISRRTVETHVSHILRKLDISNRTQLAAAASARG